MLQNNQTYYFRVNATDRFGNTGPYSSPANTTYDNEMPSISPPVTNDDQEAKTFTISSSAWDSVSGIFDHTISYTITSTTSGQTESRSKSCGYAASFGGISQCSTDDIHYQEKDLIAWNIRAVDRAGNVFTYPESGNIVFMSNPEHPLAEFVDHDAFISIGETGYPKVYVRNLNPSPDVVNVSLAGTYPQGLAKFLWASSMIWNSTDMRSISVQLNPYEQKTFYVEVASTDEGRYTLDLNASSQNFAPLSDADEMGISVGFNATFPGIEIISLLVLLALSTLAYWKIA